MYLLKDLKPINNNKNARKKGGGRKHLFYLDDKIEKIKTFPRVKKRTVYNYIDRKDPVCFQCSRMLCIDYNLAFCAVH